MNEVLVWQEIRDALEKGDSVIFLVVLESEGSSPGRQGFKMMVGPGESMAGSIGGGIMEHKFVEKARDMLKTAETDFVIREQIHSKDVAQNQSGMICSGRQRIVLFPIGPSYLPLFQKLENAMEMREPRTFRLGPKGPKIKEGTNIKAPFHFDYQNDTNWLYEEEIGLKNTVHIIGGGHVGLATSRVFSQLDFYIKCYDDRPDLNTMAANEWAHSCITLPYAEIGDCIDAGSQEYVLIMTFGYRGDADAIRALLNKDFAYIGMMGSKTKVDKLLDELRADGFEEKRISAVHTPIGIEIGSKSPSEIAISVAAEVIRVKNSALS